VFKLYIVIKQIIKNIIIFNFLIKQTVKHNSKNQPQPWKKNREVLDCNLPNALIKLFKFEIPTY
jgi:hypothetical protein